MIMINAIAEAKTGRSMKKFMTQINSVVGAGGIRDAETSISKPTIIAVRFLNGRRDSKSIRKTRALMCHFSDTPWIDPVPIRTRTAKMSTR